MIAHTLNIAKSNTKKKLLTLLILNATSQFLFCYKAKQTTKRELRHREESFRRVDPELGMDIDWRRRVND